MTDLRSIKGKEDGPPAKFGQIAALEFKAVKEFRSWSPEERDRRLREISTAIYTMSQLALGVLAKEKKSWSWSRLKTTPRLDRGLCSSPM